MKIFIDGTEIDVGEHYRLHGHIGLPEHPTMSGAQIAAAVGKDATYEVWLCRTRPLLDQYVPMTEPVILEDGMRFTVASSFIRISKGNLEDRINPNLVYRHDSEGHRVAIPVSDDSSIRSAFAEGLKTEEKK